MNKKKQQFSFLTVRSLVSFGVSGQGLPLLLAYQCLFDPYCLDMTDTDHAGPKEGTDYQCLGGFIHDAVVVNHLLTKMLTLAGTARYRTGYGEPETPTKQAYRVLNGIGGHTTECPLPDSKSSGGDTVGDHGWE